MPPSTGLALASLVLGILAVALSFLVLGAVLGLIGVALGMVHLSRKRGLVRMAWWGMPNQRRLESFAVAPRPGQSGLLVTLDHGLIQAFTLQP